VYNRKEHEQSKSPSQGQAVKRGGGNKENMQNRGACFEIEKRAKDAGRWGAARRPRYATAEKKEKGDTLGQKKKKNTNTHPVTTSTLGD